MLHVSLLGPVEIASAGRRIPLAGRRPIRLLVSLALADGAAVHTSRLIDRMWGDEPPRTAAGQLQTVVWRLRTSLSRAGTDPDVIDYRACGYALRSGTFTTDLAQFRRQVALAGDELAAGSAETAVAELRSALGLWRGSALLGIGEGPLSSSAVGMEEEQLHTLEQCLRLEISLGRWHSAIAGLRELTSHHPFRESLHCLLALALYRAGRQDEALSTLRRLRAALARELAVAPGPEATALEQAILHQENRLFPPRASPLPGTPDAGADSDTLELRQIQRSLQS
jgi:DNA-binding SARP family transcriptional activator